MKKEGLTRLALVAGVLFGTVRVLGAGWVFSGDTARTPTAEVTVAVASELDTRTAPVFVLNGLKFTSLPPSGLYILIR